MTTDETAPRRTSRAEQVRARAAKARRRTPLGVAAIVDVALRIVDEEGTDAVSMRRVAAEFDTGPASLYAHVKDKDELLRLVLDRIVTEIEVPPGGDWQQVVRSWAYACREVFQRHGDAALLSFAHVPSGEDMLDVSERVLGAMIEGGVPAQVAAWALDNLSLYVGADAYEGWLYGERFRGDSGKQFFDDLAASFTALPSQRYPHLTASVTELMTGDGDERFGFGLEMFLAGIATQVRAPTKPPAKASTKVSTKSKKKKRKASTP